MLCRVGLGNIMVKDGNCKPNYPHLVFPLTPPASALCLLPPGRTERRCGNLSDDIIRYGKVES